MREGKEEGEGERVSESVSSLGGLQILQNILKNKVNTKYGKVMRKLLPKI